LRGFDSRRLNSARKFGRFAAMMTSVRRVFDSVPLRPTSAKPASAEDGDHPHPA
jgi:hypothetical protein